MKTAIIVFFVLLSASASAQNTMGLHVGTYHSSNIECDNGNNPGVYFHASNGMTVGAYHNSCERQSVYVGYKTSDWHGVAIMAIAVTGYDRPITPVAFPTAAMRIGDVRLRISGGTWDNQTVVHFSAERSF